LVFAPACKDPMHRVDRDVALELVALFDRSETLQWRNYQLNSSTETVVTLTPTDIAPKTENCTKLFNQAGVPPDVLSLNPGGYIVLKPGATQSVVITGGKAPYDVRLMCDCFGNGISASVIYDSGKGSIKITASDGAKAGTYPLMVADSTGIGRPLTLVVDPFKKDDSDLPDCAAVTAEAVVPKTSKGGKSIVASIKAASNAALAEDQNALISARQAIDLDTKAQSSNDGSKILGYLSDATAAASKTKKYAASAQTYANKVSELVAVAKDPTLKVYDNSAGAAAVEAASQVSPAEDAVKRIAKRLSTVVGNPR